MLRPRFVAGLLVAATALTGCATGSANENKDTTKAATTVDADAFPVTIEHAFGETTIEEEPTRVATLGWTDQDNALALGVVPVGATKLTWGGNKAGSSDWFDAELEELGGTQPVRYDDADGAPIEEVAKLAPDLILATNSGITEAEYKKLSKIAPVVAYPEAPWITPWQVSLETAGKALGRTSLAEEVAEEAQEQIDQAKADYPEIQGKSLIFGYLNTADLSSVGFYMPADPRVKFMLDLGFVSAPALEGLVKPGLYYGTVSAERASELESDVLLTYGESDKDLATFTKDKLLGQLPALKAGHAYAVTDKHIGLATTNPSPLSIPYVIAHYLPDMVKAVSGS